MPGKLYNATSKNENHNTQSRSYKSSSYINNSGGVDDEGGDDLIVSLNLEGDDYENWPYFGTSVSWAKEDSPVGIHENPFEEAFLK